MKKGSQLKANRAALSCKTLRLSANLRSQFVNESPCIGNARTASGSLSLVAPEPGLVARTDYPHSGIHKSRDPQPLQCSHRRLEFNNKNYLK